MTSRRSRYAVCAAAVALLIAAAYLLLAGPSSAGVRAQLAPGVDLPDAPEITIGPGFIGSNGAHAASLIVALDSGQTDPDALLYDVDEVLARSDFDPEITDPRAFLEMERELEVERLQRAMDCVQLLPLDVVADVLEADPLELYVRHTPPDPSAPTVLFVCQWGTEDRVLAVRAEPSSVGVYGADIGFAPVDGPVQMVRNERTSELQVIGERIHFMLTARDFRDGDTPADLDWLGRLASQVSEDLLRGLERAESLPLISR